MHGSRFATVILAALLPLTARAQGTVAAAADSGSVSYLHSQYVSDMGDLHRRFAALADVIPADRYSWRPAPGVRSVSEVLMHVAGEWSAFCAMSVGARPDSAFVPLGPAMKRLEQVTAKADVQAQFERSWTTCQSVLAAAKPEQLVPAVLPARMPFAKVVLRFTADQHEHLGQLIAYARSVGVTPPWSK